ncbi:DUF3899 domain-containing protein [Paenisporosarcina cavernae]|uniref:DUF3899 domain-containing protein n=1 Tax=Paenisporosarcina cavernae TaxID=2320858 RepID=A0A385YQH5_9BACL|nr:DUF3899 domain-containing protein [Paenisporosarcina cavernae]AYC29009.1 DUF3899 domain-containing protein [Paenisporosarcina cavernae]
MTRKLVFFGILEVIIAISMLLYYKNFSLLSYINVSFVVGGIVFLLGIFVYVVAGGFFDIFTKSIRDVFTRRHQEEDMLNMRLPSQVIDFSAVPFFQIGGTILLTMVVALVVYYL